MTGPSTDPFDEVWIRLADGRSLCGLINGDQGFLMYMAEEGDTGLTSRNPEYSGAPDETIEYRLSNGQRDEYPAAWAISSSEVREALEQFRVHQRLPDWIVWYDESGYGRSP